MLASGEKLLQPPWLLEAVPRWDTSHFCYFQVPEQVTWPTPRSWSEKQALPTGVPCNHTGMARIYSLVTGKERV